MGVCAQEGKRGKIESLMGYIIERSRAPVDVRSSRGTSVRLECTPLRGAMLSLQVAPLESVAVPGTGGAAWHSCRGAAKMGPLLQRRWIPNVPSPSQTFLVLNPTLLWEWCQADLSVEHTNPLTDFILQSEYYPAENIPSAQH